MQHDKLVVGGHAVLLQGFVVTDQVDLSSFGKVVENLCEQEINTVIRFESKLDPDKETFFWNNSID